MSLPGNHRLGGPVLLAGLILIGMLLTLSACAEAPATAQPPANPTVIIVQYVTQVVATVTPAPPSPPTALRRLQNWSPPAVLILIPWILIIRSTAARWLPGCMSAMSLL